MTEFLLALARINIAAAFAILVVLALRPAVRRLAGPRIGYGLWLLPMLSAAAVLIPGRVQRVPASVAALDLDTGIVVQGPATAPSSAAAPLWPLDLDQTLGLLWAAGAVVGLALIIRSHGRFMRDAVAGEVGPAVVGVLVPRIIKPADFATRFSPEEQRLVMEHERAHIVRQDSRINGLVSLIQCLCWFNPLIHLAAYLFRIDQELACDEVVTSRFPGARQTYAEALLKAQLAIRPLPLGCYWPSGTRHPLLQRIDMINRNSLSRARRLAGAASIAALAATAGAAAWAAQPPRNIAAPAAPAPEANVADICLTNACLATAQVGRSGTVKEAIAQGNPMAARALGGSEGEVWQALQQRWDDRMTPRARRETSTDAKFQAFLRQTFDTSDGSSLAFLGPQVGDPQHSATLEMGGPSTQMAMEKTYADGSWQRLYLFPNGEVLISGKAPPGATNDPLGTGRPKQP